MKNSTIYQSTIRISFTTRTHCKTSYSIETFERMCISRRKIPRKKISLYWLWKTTFFLLERKEQHARDYFFEEYTRGNVRKNIGKDASNKFMCSSSRRSWLVFLSLCNGKSSAKNNIFYWKIDARKIFVLTLSEWGAGKTWCCCLDKLSVWLRQPSHT